MICFLAGGLNGNLKAEWAQMLSAIYGGDMKIYLAAAESRKWCVDDYILSW